MRNRPPSPAKRRMARVTRARSGFFLGLLILAAGMWLALNLGWALVAFGAGACLYWVLLYDVDEPDLIEPDADGGPW
jgi:hypothetical protein